MNPTLAFILFVVIAICLIGKLIINSLMALVDLSDANCMCKELLKEAGFDESEAKITLDRDMHTAVEEVMRGRRAKK